MKFDYKWAVGTITALLFLLIVTACTSSQPAEGTPIDTPTTEIVEPTLASSVTPVFTLPETVVVPTQEPVILEGAVTTDSGLQYQELVAGDGRAPEPGDLVTMYLTGSLPDGTLFTNSSASEEPITVIFGREQLLPGWEEGLGLMKAGGKARLVLPPELAFGEQGYGMIPPNSQIILDIDLLTVEIPPQPTVVSEDDLTTTESGLQYAELSEGKGEEVKQNSIVTTHFTIWVQGENEDEFVFSSNSGEPASFVVGRGDSVFPGWDEGMLSMKAGGKRLLVIPPDLGFGDTGGSGIPPNATLVMEVELVEIRKPVTMTEVDEKDYTTTESGLKYYDIVEGEGDMPEAGQTVVVHYTGWLEDGQQFDSSLERGSPFTFIIGQGNVIPGWDEGVTTMRPGGKRQLVIPPELGYGDNGSGGVIPPGATLIFDVELIEIQP